MQFICCHAVEKKRAYKLFADCQRDSGEGQLLSAPLPVPIHNSRNHNLNKFSLKHSARTYYLKAWVHKRISVTVIYMHYTNFYIGILL